ncbi:hypothetical protein [Acidocella sp.]|jgi:hypothetical protein|uniref:hypothetical protein n=1 Tax=Acidocella sp. TaxID=50710 RepID=UPI002F3E2540
MMALQREKSSRFLKKAAQKLLLRWACGAETARAQRTKKLLFVHKKKPSFWLPT